MSNIIEATGIDKTFSQGQLITHVLKAVSLTVKAGERLAILGASGSGKSTLLHLLGGLDTPTKGDILVNKKNINQLNEKEKGRWRNLQLGFVYQFHHLLPEFTALENVAMGLLIRNEPLSLAKEKSLAILEKVGLSHRLKHKPAELSGGERQRVAIARALVTNPKALLADEPTGNLDSTTAAKIFTLLNELNQTLKISLVIVTHDNSLANSLDRKLVLKDGTFL